MQAARGDYKYWYYLPIETHSYELIQQDTYESQQERKKGN